MKRQALISCGPCNVPTGFPGEIAIVSQSGVVIQWQVGWVTATVPISPSKGNLFTGFFACHADMLSELIPYFEEFRQNFRFVDALDVAVIAVLLYAGLVWFKQTASRSVVVGVTVVTALYFLARTFDMYLTSLVFHMAFAVLLVVFVVLFQEDIRRVLRISLNLTRRQRRCGNDLYRRRGRPPSAKPESRSHPTQ